MALPNFRTTSAVPSSMPTMAMGQAQQQQTMTAGSPVSFNILKERLRASPGGSPIGMNKQDEIRANPFSQGPYGNSAFNPQKLGVKLTASQGVLKPPKAPEKPLQPYMRYSRKVWDSVKAANPDSKLWELGKTIGQMWRDLPEAEKQEFNDEYESEKQDYERALAQYKNTPAYQSYIQAKSRGLPVIDDPEPRGMVKGQGRIDIQPAEDEDDPDDGLSVKDVAFKRFRRNHALINEILSEVLVPDVRSVVTTSRMQVLKRQVQSLTMHQKKLETELAEIESKYTAKKQRFVENSEEFNKDLKKTCEPACTEEKFKEQVLEWVDRLRQEQEERARTGAPTPPSPPLQSPYQPRAKPVLHTVEVPSDEPEKPKEAVESEKKNSDETNDEKSAPKASDAKESELPETDSKKPDQKDSKAVGNASAKPAEPFVPPNVTAPPNYGPPPQAAHFSAQSQQHNPYPGYAPGYSAPYDGYAHAQAGYPSFSTGAAPPAPQEPSEK